MEPLHIGVVTARAVASGPLRRLVPAFVEHLRAQGYEDAVVREKRAFVAQLSRWLERRGLRTRSLSESCLRDFLRARRARYRPAAGAAATAHQLLRFARESGAVHAPSSRPRSDWISRDLVAFGDHLRSERGLADSTVDNYTALMRSVLCEAPAALRAPRALERLVVRRSRRMSPGRVKLLVSALRSFLRFAHVTRRTAHDLVPLVPSVPDRRHTRLPKAVPAREVERILRACDHRTARGRRDLAVLLLLARLGLRAGEVVRMTLDDLDWETGQVLVRGKGSRRDRLPLTAEIGTALTAYLRDRRAPDGSRRAFLTNRAPRRALSGPAAVSTIVRRAIERAGLRPPSRGAHLLRHSLATELLRRGAPVSEIGELLRHRHPDTTLLYARVDLAALRGIAPRWPGGAS